MFLYYAATVILRMSEEQFWICTPRKLNALLRVHNSLLNPKIKEEEEQTVEQKRSSVSAFASW